MNRVQTEINRAECQCRDKGVRLTTKRKLVLAGLLVSGKALSAYELVDLCKHEFGEVIPPVSVYRILDFLEKEQLAHKLNLAKKYVACCQIGCDHTSDVSQFLICGKCQRVKQISLGKFTEELKHDIEKAGFQLVKPQVEINCICNHCVNEAA